MREHEELLIDRARRDLVAHLKDTQYAGQPIEWHTPTGTSLPESLQLKDVAVTLHWADVPMHVVFRRRPPGGGQPWPEPSPVPIITWNLGPSDGQTQFAWTVREICEADDERALPWFALPFRDGASGNLKAKGISSAELANQIMAQLIQHNSDYEARHG